MMSEFEKEMWMMSEFEKKMWWAGIFAIGKGITYLLFMAAMIKYLWS
jgi:hypothetical protein